MIPTDHTEATAVYQVLVTFPGSSVLIVPRPIRDQVMTMAKEACLSSWSSNLGGLGEHWLEVWPESGEWPGDELPLTQAVRVVGATGRIDEVRRG